VTAPTRDAPLDGTLAALADPTRRGVLELLREGPRRAGELAAAFHLSAPAMSRHLRVLRTRGLVEEARAEADARVRLYRLRREPLKRLSDWLEELGSFRDEPLDALEGYARQRRPS
jgi:DNA-binding transcriptional ArsR family regulator